ncbi:hypothetical protein M0R45_009954 [Rubus argutus]|uniref:C2H2-type domain-containing protein n=1 Tax=Rubus argutus TaxID=59490 RepID=A0AAW1Y8Z7_RUBAR
MNNHNYNPGLDFRFPTPPPPPHHNSRRRHSFRFLIFYLFQHHREQRPPPPPPAKPPKEALQTDEARQRQPDQEAQVREETRPVCPEITTPCSECGRKFWSWKALFGHMRCHPERQWRGIDPPPDLRRTVSPNRVVTELELSMSEEDHEAASTAVVSSVRVASKKVFGSHQALGGHRASHKNVKGCFAITKSDVEVDQDHHQGEAGHGYGRLMNIMLMMLWRRIRWLWCWNQRTSVAFAGGCFPVVKLWVATRGVIGRKGKASVVMTQLGLTNNTNSGLLALDLRLGL